jgi:hypothetical protein
MNAARKRRAERQERIKKFRSSQPAQVEKPKKVTEVNIYVYAIGEELITTARLPLEGLASKVDEMQTEGFWVTVTGGSARWIPPSSITDVRIYPAVEEDDEEVPLKPPPSKDSLKSFAERLAEAAFDPDA